MNEKQFYEQIKNTGILLSEMQLQQFACYYDMLIEWNQKMNLTAITHKEEVYEKHFYDSLTVANVYDFAKVNEVCDVGAGAGFPSIPLKICFPDLQITVVDSLKKRITFLNELAAELNLDHVHLYHERAEVLGRDKNFRESFDVVIARAVARLSILSELCLPLVKVNGVFLVMKGSKINEEKDEAKKALSLLGGEETSHYTTRLPIEKSERNILVIRKRKQTPKQFPRKPGTPNKNPL